MQEIWLFLTLAVPFKVGPRRHNRSGGVERRWGKLESIKNSEFAAIAGCVALSLQAQRRQHCTQITSV